MDWIHHKRSFITPRRCYLSKYTQKTPFRLGALVWCRSKTLGVRINRRNGKVVDRAEDYYQYVMVDWNRKTSSVLDRLA